MAAVSTEAPARADLLREYIARDAVKLIENRLVGLLWEDDQDVLARFPDHEDTDSLVLDGRGDELFNLLFPSEADLSTPECLRASAESCDLAGRVLRAVVYNVDHVRAEADGFFRLARSHKKRAADAEAEA